MNYLRQFYEKLKASKAMGEDQISRNELLATLSGREAYLQSGLSLCAFIKVHLLSDKNPEFAT